MTTPSLCLLSPPLPLPHLSPLSPLATGLLLLLNDSLECEQLQQTNGQRYQKDSC
jgi:hypothetical protein